MVMFKNEVMDNVGNTNPSDDESSVEADEDVVNEESSEKSSEENVEEESENEDDENDNEQRGGEENDDDDIVDMKGEKFSIKELNEDFDLDSDDESEEEGRQREDDDKQADGEDEESEDEGKSGWADAMKKVLSIGKDVEIKNPLLAKAKKDRDIKDMPKANNDEKGHPHTQERAIVRLAKKKEIERKGMTKPDPVKDRQKERQLAKIATRGVVQLFNAVREQQKDIKSQLSVAGQSTRKREKVFKNIDKEGFLEVIQGKKRSQLEGPKAKKAKVKHNDDIKTEVKEEEDDGWSVLRDDYMLGAKMKDWDKESESEEA